MHQAELQIKTCYSLLDSLCNIKAVVKRANSYGYKALGITDNSMFGVMEFYLECKKYDIKPIIGLKIEIEGIYFYLYAKNNNGYKSLIKLSTFISYRSITLEDLNDYNDNLILLMPFSCYNEEIFNIYKERYIGFNNQDEFSKIDSVNRVFMHEVNYLDKDDYQYLDYANMIRDAKVVGEYPLGTKKNQELLPLSDYLDNLDEVSIKNISYIVSECNVSLGYTPNLLPIYNQDIDAALYLRELSLKGLNKRLNGNVSKVYIDRLNKELDVINKMGFNDYFLIVYDYVLYAKKNHILVGPGRGSAAGSLVSYTLGITEIDPIKYNLLFERFLNPERVTMPDIDIDFDAIKREDVINYVISKYGDKKVVGIITFNTLGVKQAIRDVGRVLDINQTFIDALAKSSGRTLADSQDLPHFKKLVNSSKDARKIIDIVKRLEGLPRHLSLHAAGVVISRVDIDTVIPLYKQPTGYYVSAYSKDYLEPLGLLKMDFLGIADLTMIDEIINNIRDTLNINITFNNIPLEDKKTLELFMKGDTEGIFQFEAPGMIKFLRQLKPDKFLDLVAATSLYRPGPMDSIPLYLENKRNPNRINYYTDKLKPILEETYGIIIYQEQIMEIAVTLAGYSLGEADNLRRAISKKKEELLLKERDKFINGVISNGNSKELAIEIYDLIYKFANYGFNKSHAVSYAMVAYRMAFLKAHFYSYFMLSLLNKVISNASTSRQYISNLRRHNVKIKGPDINESGNKYLIKDEIIITPLTIIKNIGLSSVKIIIDERIANGKYIDFIDFTKRVYHKGINKKIIEALVLAGCFDNYGFNRKSLINNLDLVINYADIAYDSGFVTVPVPEIEKEEDYSKIEMAEIEFNSFGFYLSNHPVTEYKDVSSLSTLDLGVNVGKYIHLILEVKKKKEIITKGNQPMAFLECSDEFTDISVTLFPRVYTEYTNIEKYDIINVYGMIEYRNDSYQLIASQIKILNKG